MQNSSRDMLHGATLSIGCVELSVKHDFWGLVVLVQNTYHIVGSAALLLQ